MASAVVTPFQKAFYCLCPDPAEQSVPVAAADLREVFLKTMTCKLKGLLGPGAAGWV